MDSALRSLKVLSFPEQMQYECCSSQNKIYWFSPSQRSAAVVSSHWLQVQLIKSIFVNLPIHIWWVIHSLSLTSVHIYVHMDRQQSSQWVKNVLYTLSCHDFGSLLEAAHFFTHTQDFWAWFILKVNEKTVINVKLVWWSVSLARFDSVLALFGVILGFLAERTHSRYERWASWPQQEPTVLRPGFNVQGFSCLTFKKLCAVKHSGLSSPAGPQKGWVSPKFLFVSVCVVTLFSDCWMNSISNLLSTLGFG